MRVFKLTFTAAGLLAAGTLAGYGVFGAQAAPQELRPFEGTFAGLNTTAADTTPGGPEFTFTGNGTYQATHLGSGTYEAAGTLEYNRHQHNPTQEGHVECGFVDGDLILTAANGDQLNGDIDADRSVLCQADSALTATSTLFVEVTGGTGRFEDATGYYFVKSGSTPNTVDPGTGIGTYDETGYFWGTIDY